jgi:hypothetical protein
VRAGLGLGTRVYEVSFQPRMCVLSRPLSHLLQPAAQALLVVVAATSAGEPPDPARAYLLRPVSVRLVVSWCVRGWCPPVGSCRGCRAEPGGLAVFDPLTGRLLWLCRFGICPGRTPGRVIGVRLQEGRFEGEWLFCWLWHVAHIFEKILLPVGTAGFEPVTP